MPDNQCLCLERTDSEARFTRCVAIPGSSPGLGVLASGEIAWKTEEPLAFEHVKFSQRSYK